MLVVMRQACPGSKQFQAVGAISLGGEHKFCMFQLQSIGGYFNFTTTTMKNPSADADVKKTDSQELYYLLFDPGSRLHVLCQQKLCSNFHTNTIFPLHKK